jgi:hypothetical protein
MWLALALSGLAAYVWLKSFVQRIAAATFGALLYMALPYHLVIDLYTRAAVAEVWAFVWMPLILLFASQSVQTRSASTVAKFAVCYALLIYTHLLTTLIFTPVVIVAALLAAKRGEFRSALQCVALAMALGMGLSAAYLGPALLHAHYVSPSRLSALRPLLSYENNFLPAWRGWAQPGVRGDLLWKMSWLALSSLAVSTVAFVLSRDRSKKESSFWIVVATISAAMMFSPSKFLWSAFPPLAALQFPYRFGTILTVATVALLALAADSITLPLRNARLALAAVTMTGILVWVISDIKTVSTFSPWGRSSARPLNSQPLVLDVLLPGWSQASESQYLTGLGILRLSQQTTNSGIDQVSVNRVTSREIHLTADGGGGWLAAPLLSYHGWVAMTEDGQKLPTRAASTGLLEIEAPSGFTRIRLSLPEDWMEKTALVTTLGCTLLSLILLAGGLGRLRRSPAGKPEAARSTPG